MNEKEIEEFKKKWGIYEDDGPAPDPRELSPWEYEDLEEPEE